MKKLASYTPFQLVVMTISIFLMFMSMFFPAPAGMTDSGIQVVGILIGALSLWLFVGVDWTSILVLFALMLVPEIGPKAAIAGSLGNNTVFFLILCCVISASLQKTGVAKRLALWFMSCKVSQKGAWSFIAMIYAAIFILASVLSATATLLIFLPIITTICETIGYTREEKNKFPAMLMASVIIVAQIAQATSPISHAMTLIGMSTYTSYTELEMGFAQYVGVGLPVGILSVIAWYIISRFMIKPDMTRFNTLDIKKLSGEPTPMSKQEKISATLYILTIIFWILPGVATYIFPADIAAFVKGINQFYPPIIGIMIMHLWHVDGKPVMEYKEATQSVPWNTLIFMGSILLLSGALSNKDIALTGWISETMTPLFGGMSALTFIIIIAFVTVIATNFISNAIAIAAMFAISMPMLLTVYSGEINTELVAILITVAANFSFATPTATAPIAVVLDTGWLKTGQLFNWGMISGIACAVILLLVGIPIGNMILPI